jgi:hypothetical protein
MQTHARRQPISAETKITASEIASPIPQITAYIEYTRDNPQNVPTHAVSQNAIFYLFPF